MNYHDSFVAIDTETTGFGPEARILEVAVVTFEGGQVVNEWSRLLKPKNVDWGNSRVQEALAINHINVADLEGKPDFADIVMELQLELASALWVAHNAEFDLKMLNQELARLGHSALSPSMTACTLQLARYFDNARVNKLGDVAGRYGVAQEDAHRAAVDARTAGNIFLAMHKVRNFPAEESAFRELLGQAEYANRSRFGR
jgi:DNA polymerase-3 subunit epsilon